MARRRGLLIGIVLILLLCGSGVLFWRATTPTVILALEDGNARAVAFDTTGTLLAIADEFGGAQIVRIADGRVEQRLPSQENPAPEVSPTAAPWRREWVAFSPDGRYLAQAGRRGLRVWALDQDVPIPLPGVPTGPIGALTFLADGQLQIRAGAGGIYRWRLPDGTPVSYPAALGGEWETWAFGEQGRWALTCSHEQGSGTIVDMVVNIDEVGGTNSARIVVPEGGSCIDLALSPDGTTLAVKSLGEDYYTLDWRAGQVRRTIRLDGANDGAGIAFSPDGSRLLLGGNGILSIRRAGNGSTIGMIRAVSWFTYKPVRFSNVSYSADGRFVVALCGDLMVRVWRV